MQSSVNMLIVSSNILGAWLLLEFLFWLFLLHLLYVVYGNDFKILVSISKHIINIYLKLNEKFQRKYMTVTREY